jgi:hypothetical protein
MNRTSAKREKPIIEHVKLFLSMRNCLAAGQVNHAPHTPALNPHLTKSRLNDAPRLCEMISRNFSAVTFRARFAFDVPQACRSNAASKGNKVELVWMQGV